MFKSLLITCLGVMLLLGSSVQGWSIGDIEDRFIDPDYDTSRSIFIDVKDASLVNVLKIISKQSSLSFIASPEVADKKITLYLNKVPLNQALQTVLDANGLTYQMQDDTNVFVIMAKYKTEKTKITKVYQLKYATVSSSKLNSTIKGAGAPSGGKSSAGVSSGGMEEAIKDSLSPVGKVIEDSRTNSLIITDIPAQFDLIESTISKLDIPIPQILIEVEMLDVSKSTADQIGVQYGSGGTSFTPLVFMGGAKAVNYPFSTSTATASSSGSGSSGSGSSSSGTSSSGEYTPGSFNASGMMATLQFLSTKTDARTLARPRILTLNNETAQIEISADEAISLQQTQTTTGSSSSALTAVTPERYTTGVILKVTPQANLTTREITMAVSPKVIDVILSQVGSGIFDPETRGSDSILKLYDGQTMVIGGLLRDEDSKAVSKIPVLGDLPLIGAAFRYTNDTKKERELIIFLTPHIIDDVNHLSYKGNGSSMSAQTALDVQDAADRAEDVNSSLNSYEMNKN